MRRILPGLLLLMALCFPLAAQAADDYKLGPDSQAQPGVPHGKLTHYTWTSKFFPGTERNYWVYVPAQYDPAVPACVMVFQDGGGFQDVNGQFRVPIVFDNLIAKKQMPVTVAIMIDPGVVPPSAPNALPRYNRSYEYDNPTDEYARFLLEEILPEVGKTVNLTQDGNGRALCGASSGGIASFTAAWQRPDQFSRVISFVGSFTDLRGGNLYPPLIRKTEPKPLRVFLQDGSNDQDIYSGSWFIGNNDVAAALKFGRYDYQFVVGDGGHNGRHGGAILPDAIRWIWRDYPAHLQTATETPQPILQVVQPGESWQSVSGLPASIVDLATDGSGNVYALAADGSIRKIDAARQSSLFKPEGSGITAMAFGPEGSLYACKSGEKRIVRYDAKGTEYPVARNMVPRRLTVNHRGEVYATDSRSDRIWIVPPTGKPRFVSTALNSLTGIQLTPDQSLLLLSQTAPGKFVSSFDVRADGGLANQQRFFDMEIPYGEATSGAGGMTVDTEGRLYVATEAGIQVCDQAGRVIGVLLNPERTATTSVVFGGANLDTLYTVAGGKVFARKTRAKGVLSFQEPMRPAPPRL